MEYFITHNVGEPARTALQSIIDGIQTQFAVTRLQLPPHITLKYYMSLPDTNGLETLCEQAQSLLGGVYSLYAHGNPSWTEGKKGITFFLSTHTSGVFEPASRMFIQHLPVHSYDLEELWTYHVTLAMGVQHDDVRTVCDFITERCLSFDCVFDSLTIVRRDEHVLREYKTFQNC
ncbi:MAG: 2'-5' RNA ligase family protein [Nanoarchaeota archaeon]